MTYLTLTLSNYLMVPISEILKMIAGIPGAFMESNFMKSIEKAQMARVRYMMCRGTFLELHRLSDKELKDIGISRGEIYSIAYYGK